MTDTVLIDPTIFHESNDEDKHYFTVTSPNIPGMVTEGVSKAKAATEAADAIGSWRQHCLYHRKHAPMVARTGCVPSWPEKSLSREQCS